MSMKRIRDYGVVIGELNTGHHNKISDVLGVRVGHFSLKKTDVQTGVTAIIPSFEHPFVAPLTASAHVINGFGKTAGLMQIMELGALESPIMLTNTLSVGSVLDGLVRYTIDDLKNRDIELKSFNGVVGECNDSRINNIQNLCIKQEHINAALLTARDDFEEGTVGGGSGMVCHGLKGGIGSSSRVFEIEGRRFTLGTLVMSNHGRMADLCVGGKNIGRDIIKLQLAEKQAEKRSQEASEANSDNIVPDIDKGSIIMIMACDIPLSSRQIDRVLRRATVSLARVGSYMGHGSGDVAIGFTTANQKSREQLLKNSDDWNQSVYASESIMDSALDIVFRACVESFEESILNSMVMSKEAIDLKGVRVHSLSEYAHLFEI